jgi:hypothetical protein
MPFALKRIREPALNRWFAVIGIQYDSRPFGRIIEFRLASTIAFLRVRPGTS